MELNFKEDQFRKDLDRYFELSGIRESKKLNHSPFIVFNNGTVELCDNAEDLITIYPKETKVLGQWRGQWRSDFFIFDVYDLLLFIRANPKKDYHIV